jgi:AraC-like DNA-binding protein
MEKSTKIILIVLICVVVVLLVSTTALAVALCMKDSGKPAVGKGPVISPGEGPAGQPPDVRERLKDRAEGGLLENRGLAGEELEKVSSALGLSPSELLGELRDGKTLAQIAGEKGVDTQALVDIILEPAKQLLSKRVENGKITQEQADQRLQQLKTRVEDFVNNGGPLRGLRASQGEQPDQSSVEPSSTI